jgi:2-iminobutanoate/2-iminopropanoate deaminase
MRQAIATGKAPEAIGPYSQGVSTGRMIYSSGQLPVNIETGYLETEDIRAATKYSLENCRAVIEEGGISFDDVIKTTVFMTDLKDFTAMNEVYASFFQNTPPARSCVQVAALPRGAKIEIEVIAIQ